jgi:hypothetical protein
MAAATSNKDQHQHDAININNNTSTSRSTTRHQHPRHQDINILDINTGGALFNAHLCFDAPALNFSTRKLCYPRQFNMFQPSPWTHPKEMSLSPTFDFNAVVASTFSRPSTLSPKIFSIPDNRYQVLPSPWPHPKEMSLPPTTLFPAVLQPSMLLAFLMLVICFDFRRLFSLSPWPHSKKISPSPVVASLEVPQPSIGAYGPLVSLV